MIKKIIIVDGDIVVDSNRNRQIVALSSTIGEYKVDILEKRLKDINPELEVIKYNIRFNEDTKQIIMNNSFDYIIDAIDSVKDKVTLAKEAEKYNIYMISAMGAGNRYRTQTYSIKDIYSTNYDRLARKMRYELRKEKISKLDVCIADNPLDVVSKTTFSIAYNPAIMGATIAGKLIEKILKVN